MASVNCGKVWGGTLTEDNMVINGVPVEPVGFEMDDATGALCDAIAVTGVQASIVNKCLVVTSTGQIELVGIEPWGQGPGGGRAINELEPGTYE